MQLTNRFLILIISVITLIACQSNETPHPLATYQIIPKPQTITPKSGSFVFSASTQIITSQDTEGLQFLGSYLSEMFDKAAGFSLAQSIATSPDDNTLFLHLTPDFQGSAEAYELTVTSQQITIKANHASGLFYGIQSLRQLLSAAIESNTVQNDVAWEVPAVTISDAPRFEYRGMQMDVSRHFFDADELKTFIDRLALFKFNRFHIHLTDDQGWRLQIKQYPALTERGAWRTMNHQDEVCIERAKKDLTFALPQKHFKNMDREEVYGGFYTQEQMKDVIDYATNRGITIVPEIDMPGHMRAAIDSYPELSLSCVDGAKWGKTFSVSLCPCEEGVFDFVEKVLGEVAALFPGEYIHIGADEVDKATWAEALQCQELMQREGLESVEELQSYFVKRVEQFLNSQGKKMIGWDEALEGGINASTTIMYWRGWRPEKPVEAAEGGHDVIMTPTSHCYFDYQPDDKSITHVYNFDPIPAALQGKHEDRIKGVQANLWSEYIPTMARLDYMSMPRMMSLAEVAWTMEKDETDFLWRVNNIYPRLDEIDIHYRLPDIPNLPSHDVFLKTDTLDLEKPSLIDEIRYTADGTIPDLTSTLYEGPVAVMSTTTFNIASFRKGQRVNVYEAKFEQQTYRKPESVSTAPGLTLKRYEGNFYKVADMDQQKPVSTTIATTVGVEVAAKEDNFGLWYSGYFEAPQDGVYTFYLSSDDGSTLEIGDQLVIDNDGRHGARELRRQIALAKGKHPINIRFFEAGGDESLRWQYHLKGKPTQKADIPAKLLSLAKA